MYGFGTKLTQIGFHPKSTLMTTIVTRKRDVSDEKRRTRRASNERIELLTIKLHPVADLTGKKGHLPPGPSLKKAPQNQ